MKPQEKYRQTKKALKAHSKFKDNPINRVGSLLLSLIADRTLPNIMLGALATAQINHVAGTTTPQVRNLTALAFLCSLLLYSIGDEIQKALTALKQSFQEGEDSNKPYQ